MIDWLLIDCLVDWLSTRSRPWDRGGGVRSSRPLDKGVGAVSKKNIFRPLEPQFGLKIRGRPGSPGPSPESATVIDWWLGCLVGWMIDWLIDWLIDWSIGWLRWLVDWLTYCWLTGYVGWLVDRLIDWLIQFVLELNRHTDIRRKGHFRFIKRMRRKTKLL